MVVIYFQLTSYIVSVLDENYNSNRLNFNGNYFDDNNNGHAFGIALAPKIIYMKTHKNIYPRIYNIFNLYYAWKKARKGKINKNYVIEFEENYIENLLKLQDELKNKTYQPISLKTFILRDPKTRKISKSDFRD